MDKPFNVPITVHCAIPKSERKVSILHLMDSPRNSGAADADIDENLAANFRDRLGGRSVHRLRQQMAERGLPIGSGAIQAAKQGSRGVRLETLQKFADFFECSVIDLLRSPMTSEVPWPFKRLDPASYALVGEEVQVAAEDMLISAANRAGPRATNRSVSKV